MQSNKKCGSAFGTSPACSCDEYSKEFSLVPRGDRHKTSRQEGCFLTFLTDWLMTPEPLGAEAGQIIIFFIKPLNGVSGFSYGKIKANVNYQIITTVKPLGGVLYL
jgi:hypothetical protein